DGQFQVLPGLDHGVAQAIDDAGMILGAAVREQSHAVTWILRAGPASPNGRGKGRPVAGRNASSPELPTSRASGGSFEFEVPSTMRGGTVRVMDISGRM